MKKLFFRRKDKNIAAVLWILTGLLLSWAVTAVLVTPRGSLNDFYDYGKICDYTIDQINTAGDGPKIFYLRGKGPWGYLYISLGGTDKHEINTIISFYGQNSELLSSQTAALTQGRNEIALPAMSISYFSLDFQNNENVPFYITGLFVSADQNIPSPPAFALLYIFIFSLWCALGKILSLCKKSYKLSEHLFCTINAISYCLQGLWQFWGKYLQTISKNNETFKSRIRRICFFLIFMSLIITSKFLNYNDSYTYRFFILIVCTCIFVMGCMCLPRISPRKTALNLLSASFLVFCVFTCISDFVVRKKFMYSGYWLLILWGFFFWVWGNMKQPQKLFREWFDSFEIVFWISVSYCLFCTVKVPDYYTGMTNNPNTLGEFMSIAIVILLGKLWDPSEKRFWRTAITACALDFALYYTVLSQCRAALVADFFVLSLFFFRRLHSRGHITGHAPLAGILCALLLWIPINLGSDFVMAHNHFISDHFTVYNQAAMEEPPMLPDDMVYAAQEEVTEGKIMARFKNYVNLDQFSSGRLTIYKKYLGDLNLFGHYTSDEVGGIRIGAHNSILMIGYRYGIFTMLPYTIFLACSLIYGFRYMLFSRVKENMHGFTVFGLLLSSFLFGMLDNIEQPLRYIPWFTFYFTTGFFFYGEQKEG